jgi:hypothetical protein
MMEISSHKRGFTLLLAALVASIVLALGSSIFLIARKQVTLSSLGRDSQFAFYAADTGAECALYWDIKHGAFGSSTPATAPHCAGQVLGETVTDGDRSLGAPYTIEFELDLFVDADGALGTFDDSGYCAHVSVRKNTSNPFTVIHADGYSTPCETIETSARALQRSVQLQY